MTFRQRIIKLINHLRVNAGAFLFNIPAFLFDSLFLLFNSKRNGHSSKILIVRLDTIGDFVLWTDALNGLRQLFPKDQYELVLYGNHLWTDIAKGLNVFDQIFPVNTNKLTHNLNYRFGIFKNLRNEAFAKALQPTYSRLFAVGDSLIRMASAKEKIGFKGDNSVELNLWKFFSDQWYTRLVIPISEPLMELERNAEFLQKLGLNDFHYGMPHLPVTGSIPEELKNKKYYVIFPGASVGRKQWPVLNFVEIAKTMNEKYGWTGVICGGKNEMTIAAQITEFNKVRLLNLAGKTTLEQLISVISKAQVFIGNDTAAVHIAAATNTKAISILGGGHFGRFLPYQFEGSDKYLLPKAVFHQMECYGCGWKCIYHVSKNKAAPCITNVSFENVWKEIEVLLNN